MLHQRLVNACLKRGAKITQDKHNKNRFSATTKTTHIVWYKQGDEATCPHWPNPETDAMTDLFMDRHFRTISAAADFLGPKVEKKPKRKKCKSKKAAKAGSSVKELITAAGLKAGFVVSDPKSGGEYRIGTRGRPPVWLKDRLAEMAGVPVKVLEAAVKVSKKKNSKPVELGPGSYSVNGVFHYVGEDAALEVAGDATVEKAK